MITQVLADASPRGGKEWLFSEMFHMRLSDPEQFCRIAHELEAGLDVAPDDRDEDCRCEQTAVMASMLRHLTMPPVALEVGNQSAPAKLCA